MSTTPPATPTTPTKVKKEEEEEEEMEQEPGMSKIVEHQFMSSWRITNMNTDAGTVMLPQ